MPTRWRICSVRICGTYGATDWGRRRLDASQMKRKRGALSGALAPCTRLSADPHWRRLADAWSAPMLGPTQTTEQVVH